MKYHPIPAERTDKAAFVLEKFLDRRFDAVAEVFAESIADFAFYPDERVVANVTMRRLLEETKSMVVAVIKARLSPYRRAGLVIPAAEVEPLLRAIQEDTSSILLAVRPRVQPMIDECFESDDDRCDTEGKWFPLLDGFASVLGQELRVQMNYYLAVRE